MCDPDDLGMMLYSTMDDDEDEDDMDPCSKKHKHHTY